MNNNQVCNPKVEVPTGISMNDKDYLTSLLSCLKDMEKFLMMDFLMILKKMYFIKLKMPGKKIWIHACL